jgi:hypothetical protein
VECVKREGEGWTKRSELANVYNMCAARENEVAGSERTAAHSSYSTFVGWGFYLRFVKRGKLCGGGRREWMVK